MRRILEDMLSLLQEQKRTLEELISLSREKGRVIISGDTARLDEIVHQERAALRTIRAAEKRREEISPEMAESLGIPEAELTVLAIIERISPEERTPFISLRKELATLVNTQAELNASNQELLRVQLEYAEAIMGLLSQADDPLNNFYGGDGREITDKKKTPGLFDTQV